MKKVILIFLNIIPIMFVFAFLFLPPALYHYRTYNSENLLEISTDTSCKTNFETEDIYTIREKEELVKETFKLRTYDEEIFETYIDSFAISESGSYAVCMRLHMYGFCISLYSPSGDFVKSFIINTYGSSRIELCDNYLNIYSVRSSVLFSIDCDTYACNVYSVLESSENRNLHDSLGNPRKNIGEFMYELKGKNSAAILFDRCTKLIKTNTVSGESVVLYDSKKDN